MEFIEAYKLVVGFSFETE